MRSFVIFLLLNQKNSKYKWVDSQGFSIRDLQNKEIHTPEELHECLRRAQSNRAVADNQSNERSSARSHSVARIRFIGTHVTKQEVLTGNLNLVDLAGSESLNPESTSPARDRQTVETKRIKRLVCHVRIL
ncbi:protein claret segregational-like [Temnothorax curvispinosus]|uniref:Protein claret segregational-like n=1 Tax=Temnothorax curvispinosus TaxID=300111 RepID=A0A6J1R4K6_9HYME|nr:protein claret segregational-like [Temnothorax curvispinosus]